LRAGPTQWFGCWPESLVLVSKRLICWSMRCCHDQCVTAEQWRATPASKAASRQAPLAFRSLDPFRALREPDRRRRDEERPFPLRTKNLLQTKNDYLTGKAPYKFESPLLQRRVSSELGPCSTSTAIVARDRTVCGVARSL